MPGEEGVLELGQDGVVVAEDPGEERLAGPDLGDGVAPQLLLDGHGLPARVPELAEGGRSGHLANLPSEHDLDSSPGQRFTMTKKSPAWQAISSPTRATPLPFPADDAELVHGDLEVERVARDDLAPEPRLVDAAEEREAAGVALVGEHGERADLGEGLDDEHAGQRRPAGEVPGEERLVAA